MMTDKEFLSGIYMKAELVRAEENQKDLMDKRWKGGRVYKRLVPAMALCFLAVIAIPVYQMVRRPAEEGANTPPIETDSGGAVAAPAANEPVQGEYPKPNSRMVPMPFAAEPPALSAVHATVRSADIENGQWKVELEVIDTYQGSVSGDLIFKCDEAAGFQFKDGEEGLYYLEETQDGYVLSNGSRGRYLYSGTVDGTIEFEADDGTKISDADLREQE